MSISSTLFKHSKPRKRGRHGREQLRRGGGERGRSLRSGRTGPAAAGVPGSGSDAGLEKGALLNSMGKYKFDVAIGNPPYQEETTEEETTEE